MSLLTRALQDMSGTKSKLLESQPDYHQDMIVPSMAQIDLDLICAYLLYITQRELVQFMQHLILFFDSRTNSKNEQAFVAGKC